MKKKLKLAFIVKASKRRSEFRKRKSVWPSPEVWPSREGFEEVVSAFMGLPEPERVKNRMDHASYLEDRIRKEEDKVKRLREENRKTKLKQFMFDCVEGKKKVSECDVKDLGDFSVYINDYICQLNTRIEHLKNVGDPSAAVADTTMGEAVQHQTPVNFSGQTQHGIYDINQQGSFFRMQQMGNVGEHGAHMPFMDDNNNKPPPTTDH